ncbi:MAG: cell division protein FtsB [Massilia sp.]|jgi:cell division protein FtsB
MRLITLALAALLLLIQYPLWLGKGGMLAVSDLRDQVALAQLHVDKLKARNAKLDSEVRDLREGTGAVEERARLELGMIKQNEIFVQVLRKDEQPVESMTVPPPPPPPKPGKDGKPAAPGPTH